jgi:hypothetical protein
MAVKRLSSFWQLMHLFIRFLGVTGVVGALAGWFIWGVLQDEDLGIIVVASSVGAMALAALFEVRGIARITTSRRGAFGFNAFFQIVIALVLVGAANYWSFGHFKRIDFTRKHDFELDETIRDQLAQMRGQTEIIVFQKYRSFAQRGTDEPDKSAQRAKNEQEKIDLAAQRKIIEKIKDLVEQFQDIGPRFHVHILDMKDDNYDNKLRDIRSMSDELADAILSAPENSVFFYSKEAKNIQRLSFSDIYQVDTQSSIEKKNLVLQYQGEKPFANKIFNIEEKKPRIALAVVHPLLGFQNKEGPMYTMSGAKKLFDNYGYDSMDVMLRKLSEDGDLTDEPTALTYDESRYEQIEDELAETEDAIKEQQKELDESNKLHTFWSESSLAKLNAKYVYYFRQDGRQGIVLRSQMDTLKKSGLQFKFIDVDEDDRKNSIAMYKQNAEILKHVLERNREEKDNLIKEKATLKVENLAEKRRLTDVEAKAKRMLANVDLVIVPRITIMNAPTGRVIPNRVHRLDKAQLNALKWHLQEGKPILFLLGPTNEPRETPDFGAPTDQLESMLVELGFKLPKQTILYNIEAREFNARKFGGAFGGGNREVEIPGLKLDDTTLTVQFTKTKELLVPHPIRTSLTLMGRSGGKTDGSEVRIRHPRPVYFMRTTIDPKATTLLIGGMSLPGIAGPLHAAEVWFSESKYKPDDNAVFLITREESWNENHPFILKNKPPSYTPPKADDPKKDTVEEPRRGPFPIGVAVETTIPASWYDKEGAQPKTARIAVIGSGAAFVGPELSPLKEKMLLDVTNWLIGRDDLLAHEVKPWEYPRVDLDQDSIAYRIWEWGARLGLPLAFIYFGAVVGLVRRMR